MFFFVLDEVDADYLGDLEYVDVANSIFAFVFVLVENTVFSATLSVMEELFGNGRYRIFPVSTRVYLIEPRSCRRTLT